MQIKMELPGEVNKKRIDRDVLPVGYESEMDSRGEYWVYKESTRIIVGSCSLQKQHVQVDFYTGKSEGRDFVTAFGLRFPELNPVTLLHGIVYKTPDDKYQLDKMPLRTREGALQEMKHYVATGTAYYVTFFRGNWTEGKLFVNNMWPIDFDGALGPDEGLKLLSLGNIENDKTM